MTGLTNSCQVPNGRQRLRIVGGERRGGLGSRVVRKTPRVGGTPAGLEEFRGPQLFPLWSPHCLAESLPKAGDSVCVLNVSEDWVRYMGDG